VASENDFLGNLGSALNTQFLTGDSKQTSLDLQVDGHTKKFGLLGDFANRVDQTSDRSYLEEGAHRVDYYNYSPKQLQISLQDPEVVVLVKKRMFNSLSENFRPDLFDQHEKLFYRTTKILFQNKCTQIASYERLSKIAQISSDIGRIDYHLLPIIFSLTDNIIQQPSAIAGIAGQTDLQDSLSGSLSKFSSVIDRVREIYALSQNSQTTSWIAGIPNTFKSSFSEGTGVIEFTNVTSLTTTTTLDFAKGNFTLNIADPYKIMRITNLDIEKAISDAINKYYSNSYLQLGISSLDDTISFQKRELNLNRRARGANDILFIVDPDSYFGKRVRAIVDIIGFELTFDGSAIGNFATSNNIDPSALQGSPELGNNGLSPSDVSLFNNIVSSLYTQISLTANTRRQAIADNQDPGKNLNLLRKKMRLHYGGKLVIQPMDNVHVFISSKKKVDNKILGGLQSSFAGLGFLQGLNNLTQDIKDIFAINENYSLEKSIFVGSDFPNWLWQIMRSQIVSDKDGAHVFAGIVESSQSTFDAKSGTYTVVISGGDNAKYFDYGIVNFKPSLDVFNGSLYDPMTPFKLEFDSVTGVQSDQLQLLDENKALFNSAFVKDKNGLFAGITTTENNFLLQDADRLKNNSVRRVFYDPEGMVYRWKEGIQTLALYGDSYESNPKTSTAPAITADPFAGQDVMNIMSLIITGEPYNFATYYKSAVKYDNFKRDEGSNKDPSNSYFRGLTQQLKYRNLTYGNFVPFKQLTVDDATFRKVLNNQLNALAFDSELQRLVEQRAHFADQLSTLGFTSLTQLQSAGSADDKLLSSRLKQLDTQIQDKIKSINTTLNDPNNPPVKLVGDDISFDYDNSNLNSGSQTRLDDASRRDLRRKVAFLTRRLAWKVRANEDMNFFIVDDTYDKDYDIQAFETQFITNFDIFKSEYLTVADKIKHIGTVLNGLEYFCNTQGHIEARIPKYNRMPSSVFYKMLRMKNELGIQIFPQFLEDLSTNQLEGAYQEIETLEDEIRLYCLAIGYIDDASCVTFINSFDRDSVGNINTVSGNIGHFSFVSDESTGKVINTISLQVVSQPEALFSSLNDALSDLQSQRSLNLFNVMSRAQFVSTSVLPTISQNDQTQYQTVQQILQNTSADARKDTILSRLQGSTAQIFEINQLFMNTNSGTIPSSVVKSTDILQVANGIASRISARQRAIKVAVNALQSLQEGITLTQGAGGPGNQSLGNSLLHPTLSRSKNIPKTFEHMIEDESYDDLGVGSGSRYVIKNRDIMSYTVTENQPEYSAVEVTGRVGDLFLNQSTDLPQDLNISQNGNALNTAVAVDYDLWRMYGVRNPTAIDAPYLLHPDIQCAPFAVSMLNRARRDILQSRMTVIGNEYQQPGEVVYVEEEDLLFYVKSVTHNFSYGNNFTTELDLRYGHNPGEYIPTFLDVFGKMLYKNNKQTVNLAHKRQGNIFNQEHIATLVGNVLPNSFTGSAPDDFTNTTFGASNRLAFQRIVDYAGQSLNQAGSMLELRTYYNSSNGTFSSPNSYATKLQNSAFQYLIGSSDLLNNVSPTAVLQVNQNRLSAFGPNGTQQIIQIQVKSNADGEFRYPSNTAFYYAREIVDKSSQNFQNSSSSQIQQNIDNAIYSFMVDVWVLFNNPN
jgi:hypothetical protein